MYYAYICVYMKRESPLSDPNKLITDDEERQQRSLNFTTGGSYTHVCGRVRGYQGNNIVAFYPHG